MTIRFSLGRCLLKALLISFVRSNIILTAKPGVPCTSAKLVVNNSTFPSTTCGFGTPGSSSYGGWAHGIARGNFSVEYCGTCIQVFGSLQEKIYKVHDICPNCTNIEIFDPAEQDFRRISPFGDVQYRLVQCPVEATTTTLYLAPSCCGLRNLALTLVDSLNPVTMDVQYSGSTIWRPMTLSPTNQWLHSRPAVDINFPVTIRATSTLAPTSVIQFTVSAADVVRTTSWVISPSSTQKHFATINLPNICNDACGIAPFFEPTRDRSCCSYQGYASGDICHCDTDHCGQHCELTYDACSVCGGDGRSCCGSGVRDPHTGLCGPRKLELAVRKVIAMPDGYPLPVIRVSRPGRPIPGRSFPGPLFSATIGDVVDVTIFNEMVEERVSLHWHGLHQWQNAWYDGTEGVTECGLAAGDKFTYQLNITETGTFWYHSHTGAQYVAGLQGPIILSYPTLSQDPVHQRFPYTSDYIIMVSEWFHETAGDLLTGYLGPWGSYHRFTPTYPWPPQSILMNGKGRFNCSRLGSPRPYAFNSSDLLQWINLRPPSFDMGQCYTELLDSQPDMYFCQRGQAIRIRLVCSSANIPIRFWVDSHDLLLVARDGVEIEPVRQQFVTIPVGQRVDVLINCSQNSNYSAFYMFAAANPNWFPGADPGYAETYNQMYSFSLLRYSDFPLSHLVIAPPNPDPRVMPWNATAFSADTNYMVEYQYQPLPSAPLAPPANRRIVIRYYAGHNSEPESTVEWWFLQVDNQPPISYRQARVEPLLQRFVAGSSFNSTLDGPYSLKGPTINEVETVIDGFFGEHRIPIAFGEVVEVVMIGVDPMQHPWHLHGASIWLLGAQRLNNSSEAMNFSYQDQFGGLSQSVRAQQGDTWTVPQNGYMVFRLQADNPGPWFMHCHIDWHMALGMAVVLDVGVNEGYPTLSPTPDSFQLCGEGATFGSQLGCRTPVLPSYSPTPSPVTPDNGPGRTLVRALSDLHLGNAFFQSSRYPLLKQFLLDAAAPSSPVKTLVFCGDIFELWTYPLSTKPPTFVELMASLQNGVDFPDFVRTLQTVAQTVSLVAVVSGNHDQYVDSSTFSAVFGNSITFYSERFFLNHVRFEHGHLLDIFNAPDPHNLRAFGYYVSRLAATSGYGADSSSSSLLFEWCSKLDPTSLFARTVVFGLRAHDAWQLVLDAVLNEAGQTSDWDRRYGSLIVKGGSPKMDGADIKLRDAVSKYRGMINRWRSHWKGHRQTRKVAGMLKAACERYTYWIERVANPVFIMGHTHKSQLRKYSRTKSAGRGKVIYGNTGSWVGTGEMSYIDIAFDSQNFPATVSLFGVTNAGVSYLIKMQEVDRNENEKYRAQNHISRRRAEPGATTNSVLPGWLCDPLFYNASDGCDCECGVYDPDCDYRMDSNNETTLLFGCEDGLLMTCARDATCVRDFSEVDSGWTCDPEAFGGEDGCDCNCGAWDPDCDDEEQEVFDCEGRNLTCGYPGVCVSVEETPKGWLCDPSFYNSSDGCDCDCGVARDPDCDDPTQHQFDCEEESSSSSPSPIDCPTQPPVTENVGPSLRSQKSFLLLGFLLLLI